MVLNSENLNACGLFENMAACCLVGIKSILLAMTAIDFKSHDKYWRIKAEGWQKLEGGQF